jgi:hypothetical protein
MAYTDDILHIGVTDAGLVTTTGQGSLDVFDDENDFLQAAGSFAEKFPTLPAFGELVEKDVLYNYNDTVVRARQEHFRTEHEPMDVPTLFSVYRPEGEDLKWIAQEAVLVGYIRTYLTIQYICVQTHQTQLGWEPPQVPALWNAVASGVEWTPNEAVVIGDERTYLVGWEVQDDVVLTAVVRLAHQQPRVRC